jgi:uncharacterized protein
VKSQVQGVGLGLRWELLDELVAWTDAAERGEAEPVGLDFLEVAPENYIGRGGRYAYALSWLAERYPIVTHGLTLSIGSTDPLDAGYLADLARMVEAVKSPWHSDHLCFSASGGRFTHELLPVARKEANVARVAERICRARDAIGLPLAIENVSAYWHPGRAEMSEPEFLSRVCEAADCGLLLDVNNAYVNSLNFGFDLEGWMRSIPFARVVQIHVAGHEWHRVDAGGLGEACEPGAADAMVIDTHGADVPAAVHGLLAAVLAQTGPVPVLLERDTNIPTLRDLVGEVGAIRRVAEGSLRRTASAAENDAAVAEVGQEPSHVDDLRARALLAQGSRDSHAERVAGSQALDDGGGKRRQL